MKSAAHSSSFKGNKQSLPSKPCVACGRPMSWRKRWERCWNEVKFCSDACRKARVPSANAPGRTPTLIPSPAGRRRVE